MFAYWMNLIYAPFRSGSIDPDSVGPGGGSNGTIAVLVVVGLVILIVWMTKKDSESAKQAELESQRFYQELREEKLEKQRKEADREASSRETDESGS